MMYCKGLALGGSVICGPGVASKGGLVGGVEIRCGGEFVTMSCIIISTCRPETSLQASAEPSSSSSVLPVLMSSDSSSLYSLLPEEKSDQLSRMCSASILSVFACILTRGLLVISSHCGPAQAHLVTWGDVPIVL